MIFLSLCHLVTLDLVTLLLSHLVTLSLLIMLSLTKQERLVLCLLGSVILTGSLLHLAFQMNAGMRSMMNFLDGEKVYYQVDLNRATKEELISLPMIGEVTAKRIIAYRQKQGRFSSVDELRVAGVYNFEKIKKFFKVSSL